MCRSRDRQHHQPYTTFPPGLLTHDYGYRGDLYDRDYGRPAAGLLDPRNHGFPILGAAPTGFGRAPQIVLLPASTAAAYLQRNRQLLANSSSSSSSGGNKLIDNRSSGSTGRLQARSRSRSRSPSDRR